MSKNNLPALSLATTPSAGKPTHIFLTPHNTAIVPARNADYFKRIETWVHMVGNQPEQPVLVELDRNKPVIGSVDGCILSHLIDNAMQTKPFLDLLAELSKKCMLVVLFDFKNSWNPLSKTHTCQPDWRELLKKWGIKYVERVKVNDTRGEGTYKMETLTNNECGNNKDELSLDHRKTYAAGKLPLLSPLYAVWNCNSDSLAHDIWQLQNVRDCLIRALHTNADGMLTYQKTDYSQVTVNVSGPNNAQIAYLEMTGGAPEKLVQQATLRQGTSLAFKTAASFKVVAVLHNGAWLAYRLFDTTVALEPIAAKHLMPIGYSAKLVRSDPLDSHVQFTQVA